VVAATGDDIAASGSEPDPQRVPPVAPDAARVEGEQVAGFHLLHDPGEDLGKPPARVRVKEPPAGFRG